MGMQQGVETPPNDPEGEWLRETLAVAAAFRFLARAFSYPHPGQTAQLMVESAAIPWPAAAPHGAFRSAWEQAGEESLREEYMRLFLGGGVCSLHETSYGDARRVGGQPVELADIGGFYKAFGVEPSPAQPDLPDHLCTELEFYSLLLVKEAYARNEAWTEQAQIAADASAKFLEYHLGRWIVPLVEGIREHGGPGASYAVLATTKQNIIPTTAIAAMVAQ
ncbi:MAG: molecular chaperone TorD family protein, partial [Magnetococcales bacterium]|nr:molecular chaperone TorD family protein [Magnetococcales bacterium]